MATHCVLGLIIIVALTGGQSVTVASAPQNFDPEAAPGRLAHLPDGRRINFWCAGTGKPTVVFEGGFGATAPGWYKVMPTVAKHHRACAYDRAGSGFSDPGPFPRDGAAIARDLDQALKAAEITGPYVLVGHSAGGLYMRLLADRRPKAVVGMVLVDPSVEYQDQRLADYLGRNAGSLAGLRDRAARCFAAAQRGLLPSSDQALAPCTPRPKAGQSPAVYQILLSQALLPSKWQTQISELDTLWKETSDQVHAGRRSYGDMPLIVLTAGVTYARSPPAVRAVIEPLWARLHQEIAHLSSRGTTRLIADSTHMMIFDRPDAIVQAIDDVSSASRR